MIKVCFISSVINLDQVVINLLRKEMIRLAEIDTHLEFWFFGCRDEFSQKAVQFIQELRAILPENKIDIVAVVDPIRNEWLEMSDYNERVDGFPSGAVTRLEYSCIDLEKTQLDPHRFVEHYRKVSRRYMEQCDLILALHYDNLPHPVNTEVKRLRKKKKPEVVSIYNHALHQQIEACIMDMEGREGDVLRKLREGSTYREISIEYEVTINRIQQIANKAVRKVMKATWDKELDVDVKN